MPKIIENVRGMIISEATRQLNEGSYDSVTIRGIAKGCGIGLGTFYNYFKSKDMLIASFLLEDWMLRVKKLNNASDNKDDPMVIVEMIYTEVNSFIDKHKNIFHSTEARKSFRNSVFDYHSVLRSQIAEPISKVCCRMGFEDYAFLSEFTAEAILVWAVEGKSFEEVSAILNKLFIK